MPPTPTTDSIPIDKGISANTAEIAVYDITEDAKTKRIQRISINKSDGSELTPLPTQEQNAPGYEDTNNNVAVIEERCLTQNITTNTTTTITARYFHSIVVNTKGATGNQAIIKDGSTVLGTVDTTSVIGELAKYQRVMSTNITIVTQTGTPADITVKYKT